MAKAKNGSDETATALARIGAGAAGALAKVPADNYAIVTMATNGSDDVAGALAENLGGASLSAFDFQRIKVPSGESLAWNITDAESGEPSAEKDFEGIIVSWNDQKAFWRVGLDQAGAKAGPPNCFSLDTIMGQGDPGIQCAICPNNKFGTARGGAAAGKACKDVRLLFVCRPGDVIPELVPIPPTSLKNVRSYFLRLAGRGVQYWRAITRFKLVRDKQAGTGTPYAKVDLECIGIVSDENMQAVKAYSQTMRNMLNKATVQIKSGDLEGEPNRVGVTVGGQNIADRTIGEPDAADGNGASADEDRAAAMGA